MQNLMEEDDTSSVESLDISWLEEFERTDKDLPPGKFKSISFVVMFDVVIFPSVEIFPFSISQTPSLKIIIPFIDLKIVGIFDIDAILFFIILIYIL